MSVESSSSVSGAPSGPSGSRPESGPPRPKPPTGGSPGALVRWNVNVINSHDAAAQRQIWAPDIRVRFPSRTLRGPDETEAFFSGLYAAVPDLTLTIEALVEKDEDVFLQWRLAGHHSGDDWEGIAASGARIDLDGIDHFTISEGLVRSNFVVFDQMQFARQVGLLPADGSRLDVGLKTAFNVLARRRHRG